MADKMVEKFRGLLNESLEKYFNNAFNKVYGKVSKITTSVKPILQSKKAKKDCTGRSWV